MNIMKLSVITICLFLCVGISANGFSQTIVAAWKTAPGVEKAHPATTIDEGIEIASLSRGPGLGYINKSTHSYVSTFPIGQDKAAAKSGDSYYEVIIKAKKGKSISLSALDARVRRSSTASVKYYRWSYSLNGTDFKEIGAKDVLMKSSAADDTNGEEQVTLNLSGISELQHVPASTTITFRMHAWGGRSETVNFGFGKSTFSGKSVNPLFFSGAVHAVK